ncbi:MAG TPA: non-canonical purine NTP diphosphatase [Prolixibacteraceae bacterium]|nr:non-canonical purine NTP diphosphatase [Prolixibacteraceae bacterium]
MHQLVFATNNEHKLRELGEILKGEFTLLSLNDISCSEEIPETGDTLEANASQKSFYIWDRYKIDCFSDDTGLEVAALNNEPGVRSARYAGDGRNSEDNVTKVLQALEGNDNREACFRCVISLIIKGKEYLFEGRVDGRILPERKGGAGFGYDPIFCPEGYTQSFAEMDAFLKNSMSHRGRAVRKLVRFLTEEYPHLPD